MTKDRERGRRPERPDTLVTFLRYYSRGSQMIDLVMRFIVKLICERPKASGCPRTIRYYLWYPFPMQNNRQRTHYSSRNFAHS